MQRWLLELTLLPPVLDQQLVKLSACLPHVGGRVASTGDFVPTMEHSPLVSLEAVSVSSEVIRIPCAQWSEDASHSLQHAHTYSNVSTGP